MSNLRNAYSLLPYLYFADIAPGASLLIATDHPERAAIPFDDMQIPVTMYLAGAHSVADSSGKDSPVFIRQVSQLRKMKKKFRTIVIDFEREDPLPFAPTARDLLAENGHLIWLDWSLSRIEALRGLSQHLKKNHRPFSPPMRGLSTLKREELQMLWYFLLEPGLEKPRFLIPPGTLGNIPVQSTSGFKRWLSKKGGFYLQPHHKILVFTPGAAPAEPLGLLPRVVGEILGTTALPAIRAAIRQIYISTTNVLLLQVQVGEQRVFVRFPYTRLSVQRLQRQVELTSLLAAQGFHFVPRPWPLSPQPVPVMVETGIAGAGKEREFGSADPNTARRFFAAALERMTEVHQKFGEVQPLSPALFETHFRPRLEAVASRAAAFPAALERLGHMLREAFIGKRILLSVCHGDFKIGNCLFDPEGRLSGIIDWDMGERKAPTLIDVTSLLAKSLRQRHGVSLGELPLRAPHLPNEFAEIYRGYFRDTGTDPLPLSSAVLVYWLDRVYKQITFDPHLQPEWLQRNMVPVLENLDALLTG